MRDGSLHSIWIESCNGKRRPAWSPSSVTVPSEARRARSCGKAANHAKKSSYAKVRSWTDLWRRFFCDVRFSYEIARWLLLVGCENDDGIEVFGGSIYARAEKSSTGVLCGIVAGKWKALTVKQIQCRPLYIFDRWPKPAQTYGRRAFGGRWESDIRKQDKLPVSSLLQRCDSGRYCINIFIDNL